ncbi:MAG: aminotransferase class V-fold PLP-dependent enzyme, partial [Thermoleophilia bacterium]|nr:aminotransferase class V-fold PLP-dependent enzyme [Thermoleophilia bacterium]
IEAARVVYRAREAVAGLLGVSDPLRVVFCANATHALNLALFGLLEPGQHVVTTSMEHNSVMRPLRALEAAEVTVSLAPCSRQGVLDAAAVERALRPETALIVMTQASNVVGTVLPVKEVAVIARAHGVPLLVDGAQSVGALPIDMEDLGIDLLAFTGHKSLYGPTGTGGLVIAEHMDAGRLRPLLHGGTGSRSESQNQPEFLPDKFESGTANALGLAGLEAGARWVAEHGVEQLRDQGRGLTQRLIERLANIRGVTVYGTLDAFKQLPVVSFTLDGLEPGELGLLLDERFGIAARVGLHCSPLAHSTLGTFPTGTVRLSLSAFTTVADVDAAIDAVRHLAREARPIAAADESDEDR